MKNSLRFFLRIGNRRSFGRQLPFGVARVRADRLAGDVQRHAGEVQRAAAGTTRRRRGRPHRWTPPRRGPPDRPAGRQGGSIIFLPFYLFFFLDFIEFYWVSLGFTRFY